MCRALAFAALLVASLAACATAGSERLSGFYYWGHEVETFHPCSKSSSFWVVGEDSLLQPLRDKAAAVSRAKGKPYQPVYVEASAVWEGKASDGFAADYDGVYRFIAVHSTSTAAPAGCTADG